MSAPKQPRRKAGRPPLPEGTARVVLPAQRVRAETLAWLQSHPSGLGRAIDFAVTCAGLVERQALATGLLRPRAKR